MLPLWGEATQFANAEWRDWSHYTEAVSQNMNPWIKDYGTVVECAAFRWSGIASRSSALLIFRLSSCVSNFAIHHVEGGDGFLYDKLNVAGEPVIVNLTCGRPTWSSDSLPLYDEVKPLVEKGDSFSKAVQKVLINKCQL